MSRSSTATASRSSKKWPTTCRMPMPRAGFIHNRYVPHLTAQAAAYDYVHTRARGPYVAPSDANGPVAPADPGRWCVEPRLQLAYRRHHLPVETASPKRGDAATEVTFLNYAPIIVLVILALGITAVTLYRPHGAIRVNVNPRAGVLSALASELPVPERTAFGSAWENG